MASKSWRTYEAKVYQEFVRLYPQYEIAFDQRLMGRYSKVKRQADVLVRATVAGNELLGIFDCKHFNQNVDVRTIDSIVGFMDDVGASFGGVVSCRGFSIGARNRAYIPGMTVRVIPFDSPEKVVDYFVPSLDFSDARNSMYIPVL
jgi:hypothetical protein